MAHAVTWRDYPPPYDEFEPCHNNVNRADTQQWLKAAKAPGYAEVTAWAPAYENGALMYADEATKQSWANIEFGDSCSGSGPTHYSQLDKVGRRGEY